MTRTQESGLARLAILGQRSPAPAVREHWSRLTRRAAAALSVSSPDGTALLAVTAMCDYAAAVQQPHQPALPGRSSRRK